MQTARQTAQTIHRAYQHILDGDKNMPNKPSIPRICQQCRQTFYVTQWLINAGQGKCCSTRCSTRYATQARMGKPIAERFWQRVEKTETCWLWTGATVRRGYGFLRKCRAEATRETLAHRLSYALHYGPIPKGLYVCHHCDNPPCVRPDHLFLGTLKDNAHDMIAKGRNHPLNPLEKARKIDEETVKLIRRRHAQEGLSFKTLGRLYGISDRNVSSIVSRRTWKHIQ